MYALLDKLLFRKLCSWGNFTAENKLCDFKNYNRSFVSNLVLAIEHFLIECIS